MKKTTSKTLCSALHALDCPLCFGTFSLDFWSILFQHRGQFSLENYKSYFASQNLTYLKMSFQTLFSMQGIVTFSDASDQLSNSPLFDSSQTPSTLAHADYPAYLDQFAP